MGDREGKNKKSPEHLQRKSVANSVLQSPSGHGERVEEQKSNPMRLALKCIRVKNRFPWWNRSGGRRQGGVPPFGRLKTAPH